MSGFNISIMINYLQKHLFSSRLILGQNIPNKTAKQLCFFLLSLGLENKDCIVWNISAYIHTINLTQSRTLAEQSRAIKTTIKYLLLKTWTVRSYIYAWQEVPSNKRCSDQVHPFIWKYSFFCLVQNWFCVRSFAFYSQGFFRNVI